MSVNDQILDSHGVQTRDFLKARLDINDFHPSKSGEMDEIMAQIDSTRYCGFICNSGVAGSGVFFDGIVKTVFGGKDKKSDVKIESNLAERRGLNTEAIKNVLCRYHMTSTLPHFSEAYSLVVDLENDTSWELLFNRFKQIVIHTQYANGKILHSKLNEKDRESMATKYLPGFIKEVMMKDDVLCFSDKFSRYVELCSAPGLKMSSNELNVIRDKFQLAIEEMPFSNDVALSDPDKYLSVWNLFVAKMIKHQSYRNSFLLNALKASVPVERRKTLATLLNLKDEIRLNSRKYAFGTNWTPLFTQWNKLPKEQLLLPFDEIHEAQAVDMAKGIVRERLKPMFDQLMPSSSDDNSLIAFFKVFSFASITTASSDSYEINWMNAKAAIKEEGVVSWLRKLVSQWSFSKTWLTDTPRPWGTDFIQWLKLLLDDEVAKDVHELFVNTLFLTYTRQITARSIAKELFYYSDKGKQYIALCDVDYVSSERRQFIHVSALQRYDLESAKSIAMGLAYYIRQIFGLLDKDDEIWTPRQQGAVVDPFVEFDATVPLLKPMAPISFSQFLEFREKLDPSIDRPLESDPIRLFHSLFWIMASDFGYFACPKHLINYTRAFRVIEIGNAYGLCERIARGASSLMNLNYAEEIRKRDLLEKEHSVPVYSVGDSHVLDSSAIDYAESPDIYPLLDKKLIEKAPDVMLDCFAKASLDDPAKQFDLEKVLASPAYRFMDSRYTCLVSPLYPRSFYVVMDEIEGGKKTNKKELAEQLEVSELCSAYATLSQSTWTRNQFQQLTDMILSDEMDITGDSDVLIACVNDNRQEFNDNVIKKIGISGPDSVAITRSLRLMHALFYRLIQVLVKSTTYPGGDSQVYNNEKVYYEESFVATKFDYNALNVVKNVPEEKRQAIIGQFDQHSKLAGMASPAFKSWIKEMTVDTSTLHFNQAIPEMIPVAKSHYALMGRILMEIEKIIQKTQGDGIANPMANFATFFQKSNYCLEFVLMCTSFGNNSHCSLLELGELTRNVLIDLRGSFYQHANIYNYLECCMLSWMISGICNEVNALTKYIPTIPQETWKSACKGTSHPNTVLCWLNEQTETDEFGDSVQRVVDEMEDDDDALYAMAIVSSIVSSEMSYANETHLNKKK